MQIIAKLPPFVGEILAKSARGNRDFTPSSVEGHALPLSHTARLAP